MFNFEITDIVVWKDFFRNIETLRSPMNPSWPYYYIVMLQHKHTVEITRSFLFSYLYKSLKQANLNISTAFSRPSCLNNGAVCVLNLLFVKNRITLFCNLLIRVHILYTY